MQIVPGHQHRAEDLAGPHQMVKIGAAVTAACRTGTGRVERRRVVGVPGVPDVDLAVRGERLAVAAGARREHAVEHVDAGRHGGHDVFGTADAHEVARAVARQGFRRQRRRLDHRLRPLADREAADGVAVEPDIDERGRGIAAQTREYGPLDDAEQPIAGAALERRPGARRPAHRTLHGGRRPRLVDRERGTFVERHRHGGVERALRLDARFRGQAKGAPVDMRTEGQPFLVETTQFGERHRLEAPGVGEDRAGPGHEPVEAAEPGDALRAGPQHQVVGVRQHHVGAGRRHRRGRRRLDRRRGSHGHEGGCLHRPVSGFQAARARGAVGRDDLEPQRRHDALSGQSRQASP